MKLSVGEFFRNDAQSVAVEPRTPQDAFPAHHHDFNEIFIVLSGNGWHVFNNEPHFVTCGELFYVQAGDTHEFLDVDDLYLINVLYRLDNSSLRTDVLQGVLESASPAGCGRRHWQITEDVLSQVKPMLDRIAQELRRDDPVSKVMAESLFAQLSVHLYRNRFATDEEELPQTARLGHVLNYLRHNCLNEVDLDEVARRFGYSLRNFNRVFRDATATTPHTYLVKLRLGEAMRALRTTSDSITDIAFATGFNDSNYFSYTFSKITGVSPSQYRRQAQRAN